MKQFFLCLQSEFIKSKRTFALTGIILMPLTIGIVSFLIFYLKSDYFAATETNMWLLFGGNVFGILTGLLLPFFIIVVSFANSNLETRADAWKNLFTLPVPKSTVYTAKFIFNLLQIAVSLILLCLIIFADGYLLSIVKPELRFQDYNESALIISFFVKVFISMIGLYSIQSAINILWNDFIKSVGLGFLLAVTGLMLTGWSNGYLFAYSLPGKIAQQFYKEDAIIFNREAFSSLCWGILFFAAGFWLVKRKTG